MLVASDVNQTTPNSTCLKMSSASSKVAKKQKHKRSKDKPWSDQLYVEEVKALGGTEDDLELLKGVDEEGSKEVDVLECDVNGEEVSLGEIQKFINKIGIRDNISQVVEEDEEESDLENNNENEEKVDLKCPPVSASVSSGVAKMSVTVLESKLSAMTVPEQHDRLLVGMEETVPWYEQTVSSSSKAMSVAPLVINHLYSIGQQLMAEEVKLYESIQRKQKGRDIGWLKTMLSSGTLSDKMASMILLIQESPIHALSIVTSLVSMAAKKSKRESVIAIDTLKELWLNCLLPDSRKLKHIRQQPLHLLVGKQGNPLLHLLLWYYEDQLKVKYDQFLATLQQLLHDPVSNIREKILGIVFDLLYQKPEQEQLLLNKLVNKLGDPNRRIASKCIIFLLKLLNHHVNMKVIVVKEVESLLYRPNLNEKAQYYSICFLNQVVIGPTDQPLALRLVNTYFSFFKIYSKDKQFDAKILGALLTGINRALPFIKDDVPLLDEQLDSLFKVVHVGPLPTSIQSLLLLYQVMEGRQAVSARYYRALYQKLLDTQLAVHSAQQAMFLNVLFKSLKNDPELNRLKAFLKRILQICPFHSPPFVCGCLVLISELLKQKTQLWSFLLQSQQDDEVERFHDVVEEGEKEKEMEEPVEGSPADVPVTAYKLSSREPLYCKAETTCLWELTELMAHYHPTVRVFAHQLAKGDSVVYTGDPLQDFTMTRFLDQLMHKNPKKKQSDHGGSLMQPVSQILISTTGGSKPTRAADLLKMDQSKVRHDMMFIYNFLKKDVEIHRHKYDKRDDKQTKGQEESEEEEHPDEVDDDVDFASELQKQAKIKRQSNSQKTKTAESDQEASDAFSYSDMDESDFSDIGEEMDKSGKRNKKGEYSEAELERLLLENMTSEEDEEEETMPSKAKKSKSASSQESKMAASNNKTMSMFASADEFAHLLDDFGGSKDKSAKEIRRGEKQREWEERRSSDYHEGRRKDKSRGDRREGKTVRGTAKKSSARKKKGGSERNFASRGQKRKSKH